MKKNFEYYKKKDALLRRALKHVHEMQDIIHEVNTFDIECVAWEWDISIRDCDNAAFILAGLISSIDDQIEDNCADEKWGNMR